MNGKVIRIIYNETPKTEEEIDNLYKMLDMIIQHIDEGLSFRIIVEQLSDDSSS